MGRKRSDARQEEQYRGAAAIVDDEEAVENYRLIELLEVVDALRKSGKFSEIAAGVPCPPQLE